ncbi:MarR family winged helix-turn-helix transcriptional regulator [Actinomycetospora endophytica]|uniref:MarR family winged helix-turn-helix transcriptional regulator n=1 Tax=Actinomycetospora endophytica TaxID=2291215 RepID=A0ABS8P9H8_9PSEU|nr:MarR family winged helix-turn-helix transcriptional regulator [Actinomycetospora endophytica]MCD2194935.1 MarR family winged helix-turn-helix transcriptional regulator [Actinomycetospora endophytica]
MADDRPDLGALAHRLTRAIAAAEAPILAARDLTMWDYVVLTALGSGPAPTQAQLAGTTGRDQTRLIPILERLQARGLIGRAPDPDDRRRRVVTLTPDGSTLLLECRSAIRDLESRLLSGLDAADREPFVRALQRLAGPGGTASE